MSTPLVNAPWSTPHTSFPRDKIVVLNNSSVSWCLSVCQDYCDARGIPRANILSVAMGNGGGATIPPTTWMSGGRATVNASLQQPLRTKLQSLRGVAVLFGPGCPIRVQYEDAAGVLNTNLGLSQVVIPVINFKDASLSSYRVIENSGNAALWRLVAEVGSPYYNTNVQQTPYSQSSTSWATAAGDPDIIGGSDPYADYYTVPTAYHYSNRGDIIVPTLFCTSEYAAGRMYDVGSFPSGLLAEQGHPYVAVGRIGYAAQGGMSPSDPSTPLTENAARQIIDRATAAIQAHYHAAALEKPLVFHLSNNDGGIKTAETWAALYQKAAGWGINAKYAHYSDAAASAEAKSFAPLAGSLYEQTDVLANTVREYVYLLVGEWDNLSNIYSPPYPDSWIPLTGGGAMHGPSAGYQYCMNLMNKGAVAVLTDSTHITTGNEWTHYSVWHNLLRGMSWLEAFFYGGIYGQEPCGDPLWAPYGLVSGYGNVPTITSPVRTLANDTQAEIIKQHTRPFHLVQLNITTYPTCLSEGRQVYWDGKDFLGDSVRVGEFKWTPDGEQTGSIDLLNENNAATAVVLNNLTAGIEVRIYQTCVDESNLFTTPELIVVGVLDGAEVKADVSTLTVLTSKTQTEFVPNRFYCKEEGFTSLPAPGTAVFWNNERFVLEAES